MHVTSWELVTPPCSGCGVGAADSAAPAPVKISTVIAAIRQAAKEKGFDLSDQLLSLMIGQIRGAEGAYPGSGSTFAGTNNIGAAQVTKGLVAAKKGRPGWGAFAHKDTVPTASGPNAYIGWYWIAPSPLEAARHWFQDNWWGPALAKANPQTATDYAAVVYKGHYFDGNHPDPAHDPTSDNGKLNVAEYAAGIQRGVASAAELADPPADPATVTVDPAKFKPPAARQLTEDMFSKAKGGGEGSAWSYLLPSSWSDLLASNGVVWFDGSSPGAGLVTSLVARVKQPKILAAVVAGLAAIGGGIYLATRPVSRRRTASVGEASREPSFKHPGTRVKYNYKDGPVPAGTLGKILGFLPRSYQAQIRWDDETVSNHTPDEYDVVKRASRGRT